MSRTIENQLNESYRDALVAYYLSEVVPNHTPLIALGLHTQLKTANDLYEFFLLDNQVSNDVQSSYVASAISSVQQYINGALMGMEPGYSTLRPDEAQFVEWRDRNSQYPIWAANQQLALYPEVYISPDLRLKKSTYFSKLENDINQNKINVDIAQEAVKAYLASFEEIANLTVVNGYIGSTDFASGTYYFIGKSRAEGKYYWRTVDMNERAYIAGTEGPKYDHPTPGAWSDWTKAEIAVTANTLERTIRPVYFNNRLFVTWVDLIYVTEEVNIEATVPGSSPYPMPDPAAPASIIRTPNVQLLFNISYKKYDNSWSAPQIYMDFTTANEIPGSNPPRTLDMELDTIAVFDASSAPETLFIAMYAGQTLASGDSDGSSSTFMFIRTASIDKSFNTTQGFPSAGTIIPPVDPQHLEPDEVRIRKTCWVFALENKYNFQFLWHTHAQIKSVITQSLNPESDSWNYDTKQTSISDVTLTANQPSFNHESSLLRIKTSLTSNISASATKQVNVSFAGSEWKWDASFVFPYAIHGEIWLLLEEGSQIHFEKSPESSDLGRWFSAHFELSGTIENFLLDANMGYISFATGAPLTIDLSGCFIHWTFAVLLLQEDTITWLKFSGYPRNHYFLHPALTASVNPETVLNDLQQHFGYPTDMAQPGGQYIQIKSNTKVQDTLAAPSDFYWDIPIDRATLLPTGLTTQFVPNSKAFSITHGVAVHHRDEAARFAGILKSTKIELEFTSDTGTNPIAPRISTRTDASLGTAEYIDFSGSSIAKTDGSTTVARSPIRMNTLFAAELINKANIALEALLSWNTQQLLEPALAAESSPMMDFKGANGVYFWELFLHLPFMISHRLTLEKQFTDAEYWLAFIFDPARKADPQSGAPSYWNVRPLVEVSDPDYFLRSPIDPDGIAASDPVRYQKAIYFHYLNILIERGDAAYRQLTPDSLGEAKLWYVRVLDLLGPRPDTRLIDQWTPITLQALSTSTSQALRDFETACLERENQRSLSTTANDNMPANTLAPAPLRLCTFGRDPTLKDEDNDHFVPPINAELVKHWDILESRLYNLRHNFTLDGKPLLLPLFAAPLDPRALLAVSANGGSGSGVGSLLAQEVPHYRYSAMAGRASAAVETLIQFGNTLLSIIERKDQADYLQLQQMQAWEYAQFAIELQLETQKVESASRKALLASMDIAKARFDFYDKLAEEIVSPIEVAAGASHLLARVYETVSAVSWGVASALKPLPNHVGFHAGATGGLAVGVAAGTAMGGFELEGIPEVVAIGAQADAALLHGVGEALDRTEQFRRRLQEWKNAREQAELEIEQLSAQLAVHDAQTRVTSIQLRQAEVAKSQAENMYAFLKTGRFTNAQLYQWLNGQFSTLYYQAYDATLSLCLSAQSAWQYEIADYTTSFIQPGAWKDSYRGLGAGESLKLNLIRMDAAYMARNERLLEIIKTVSLRQLPTSTAEAPTLNQDWPTTMARLVEEGIVEFEITQAMLDADYPGQTRRRIKRVSVSLPAIVGPYQDIRAVLTQSYNAVQMGATLKENMRASQQIAVSTGVDDDGMFVFNFDEERYLPFEGTGVISRWTLTFPAPASQQEMIASITDIIVHIRYTAKGGGRDSGNSRRAPGNRPAKYL